MTTSRRGFLVGSGAAALGALLLAACSTDDETATAGTTTTVEPGPLTGYLAVAALAAGLENLAVRTYQNGLNAGTAGRLGTVPSAVARFATTARNHHREHAAAWNTVLTNAGRKREYGVDVTVQAAIDSTLAGVTDFTGFARVVLELENVVAATYLDAIGRLRDNAAITVAAAIQPVEMQHAAILNLLLGNELVPDAFAQTDGARTTTDQIS